MKEIRLSGMPVRIEGKIVIENYYPENPEEIMFNPCITEGKNRSGFTRLLYYPRYSEKPINNGSETKVVRTPLATTLMFETKDKSGKRKWETIGHVWRINDSKLEELGFQKWEESDYDYKVTDYEVPDHEVPKSKIDIENLNNETIKELDAWMVEQGLKPISRKTRKMIKV